MRVKDVTTHERKVSATFTELDIRALLTKKLAEDTGFPIDPRSTLIDVRFRKEDEDARGFVNYIDVTMRNTLS